MLRRTEKNISIQHKHSEDPVHKMHRHLAWALGTSTGALIINAVVVVALVEGG